jgi:hypothetical protein
MTAYRILILYRERGDNTPTHAYLRCAPLCTSPGYYQTPARPLKVELVAPKETSFLGNYGAASRNFQSTAQYLRTYVGNLEVKARCRRHCKWFKGNSLGQDGPEQCPAALHKPHGFIKSPVTPKDISYDAIEDPNATSVSILWSHQLCLLSGTQAYCLVIIPPELYYVVIRGAGARTTDCSSPHFRLHSHSLLCYRRPPCKPKPGQAQPRCRVAATVYG